MILQKQKEFEEKLNSISHGTAALISIIGFIILLQFCKKSNTEYLLFSIIIYGISLIILYTSSTIYHSVKNQKLKHIFRIIDHCSIFLLIAGTYSPVLLIVIGGETGWCMFSIQWTIALIGVIFKVFYTGKYELISVCLYILMGWMIIFKLNELIISIPESGFLLLLSGGIIYTIGIIFYVIDTKIRYSHFIWHLFVIAGSLTHYLMILKYIV